jgi:nucleotide-binding universal stress UspA family protein
MLHHPALDRHIVHQGAHTSRVRIVARMDVEQVTADLRLMFPHETVLSTPIGCCHQCVYTSDAPPSQVAERIAEHLRDMAARGDGEPAPEHHHVSGEPLPDFFGYEKDKTAH